MSQKIRIKLKSFDHNLVDKSAEKIVKTVKATGKRLIDIYNSNNKTVEALMKLELASGVEVEIKV